MFEGHFGDMYAKPWPPLTPILALPPHQDRDRDLWSPDLIRWKHPFNCQYKCCDSHL